MGGSDKVLNYASGTGTAALVFSGYTVAENDEDTDGLSIAANKLDANGGTIKATAGANLDAVLTHAAVADSASRKVDGIRPTLVTTSTDGTEVLLTFSEDLKGTSVAANLFTVKVDGTAVTLSGSAAISGSVVTLTLGTVLTSATQVVTVSYADPTSGDDSTGLQDLADNDADSFTDQMVTNRFTAPMVPSAVDLYSVAVYATTTPGSVQVLWSSGNGSTSHEFRSSTDNGVNWSHLVTDDWPDVTTDSKGLSHLAGLTPGTAYTFEVRGRNAEGPGPAGQNTGTTAAAMSITGVELTSNPAMGTTYDTGEDVAATLTFSRPVTFAEVGGNLPQLELDFGGTGKPATCAATIQQTTVVCTYTVVMGDAASAGVAIGANKLALNGGTIRLGDGAHDTNVDYDVPLEYTALAADPDHKVSATTVLANPTVDSFAFNSAGSDNTFAIGDAVTATVTFSEAVTVDTTDGTPQLTINMGVSDKVLEYDSGTGTAELVFSGYTVAANDEDTDGLSIAADKLTLNSGTIKATADATLDAVLTHAAVADSAIHKVDGIRPTLVTTSTDGTEVLLTFSEDLKGTSVAANLFTVKVDGTAVTLSGSAAISGSVVTLTLVGTALTLSTQAVTVSYADPTTGDDASGIEDLAGNDADSFTDQMVTNRFGETEDTTAPTFVSAETVATSTLLVAYDEALDPGSQPATSAFTVKVGGAARSVDMVEISGSVVTLTLASGFRPGDTLTVSYTKPGSSPIRDASSNANEAASLTETTVTNNLAATAPEAPGNLQVTQGTNTDEIDLTWTTPWANGGDITEFQVRHEAGTSVSPATTWTEISNSGPTTTTHTVDGLTEGTQYTFEVRAVNGAGGGDEASVTATAADTTAPTFVSQAWLARFGRTVASDVIDGITDRLANPRGGSEVRIAGMTLQHDGSTWTEAPVEDAEHGRRLELGHERTVAGREISAHEVLTQSAFRLQGRSDAPGGAAWGRLGALVHELVRRRGGRPHALGRRRHRSARRGHRHRGVDRGRRALERQG